MPSKTGTKRLHGLLQITILALFLFISTSARIGEQWNAQHKPKGRRSLEDLSQHVFEQLLELHEQGPTASLRVPHVARAVHRIVVEGSAAEGSTFDEDARGRALTALNVAADRLTRGVDPHDVRHLLSNPDYSRELAGKSMAIKAAFAALLVFMVVLVVSNIVNGVTGSTPWPFVGSDNSFITGALGASYKNVLPCDKLPLVQDDTFGYLPITNGLVSSTLDLVGPEGDLVNFFRNIFDPRDLATDASNLPNPQNCFNTSMACELTAECCKEEGFLVNCNGDIGVCEKRAIADVGEAPFTAEPFCLLWSEAGDGNFIDTLAFAPLTAWPPVVLIPGLVKVLPNCGLLGDPRPCTGCDFHDGWPLAEFAIGPTTYKLNFQFSGIALSWANRAKLAFGTTESTSDLKIWDGFRNVDLPAVPDINFWVSFRLSIVPLPTWQLGKLFCETAAGLAEKFTAGRKDPKTLLTLEMDFEIYVGFDKMTNADAAGNSLAGDLSGGGGDPESERRNLYTSSGQDMWRDLQETSEDPCIIISMTSMRLTVPLVGSLNFGNSVGGFCNFSPEETGVRCTPSGFFLNVDQEFKIEGGVAGVLASFLDSELGNGAKASGNSIGVFQNAEGENEAVVFRLEFPVASLFGVTLAGGPKVHFQLVKGSEVQRRRATLLRKRRRSISTEDWGPWIQNCQNVKCQTWAAFYRNDAEAFNPSDTEETEICSNILLNNEEDSSDNLLYYNRVITADPVDDSLKYLISPPVGTAFKTAPKYDFEDNPNANIVIVYLALAEIGNIVIRIKEISVSLIISGGTPPRNINGQDLADAMAAYDNIEDELKEEFGGIWRAPDSYNFPSLATFEEYLPPAGRTFQELTEEEIANALDFNEVSADNAADRLGVFVRLYCKIAVLFFVEIQIGLILENFGDGVNPNVWALAGQFQIDLLDLRYSVALSTNINFDRRRHRHLEGGEYGRALATDGLENADYDVGVSFSCVPDSFCEAFVQFFEDVGEAIWEGVQAIGAFFAEDVVGFINDAVDAVGEWGEKFAGAIVDFGVNVVNDIADIFANGEVAELLRSGTEAFDQAAKDAVATLSDGKFDIEDITQVGELVLQGLSIAGGFIVAGITDVANAIGSFFSNVAAGISDWLGLSSPWDELRVGSSYTNMSCLSECRATLLLSPNDSNKIKRNCWCTDEFECRVKIPQVRRCKKVSYVFWVETQCGSYSNVGIVKGSAYPRYDGRKFDNACREERMAKLAKAKRLHTKAVAKGRIVDTNFGQKLKGLSNFAPNSRRRRRALKAGQDPITAVNNVAVTEFQATSNGVPLDSVDVSGSYDGVQLQSDRADGRTVQQVINTKLDFRRYSYPDQRKLVYDNGESVRGNIQRAAAGPYLDGLKTNDEEFFSRQPIIEAPKLRLVGTAGTTANPIVISCAEGNLASAWLDKLESFEPESLRRRRSRRLSSHPFKETLVEYSVEELLRERVLSSRGVQVHVEIGGVIGGQGDKDVLAGAKNLLGTTGAGAFLDPNRMVTSRRLQGLSINDFDVDLSIMSAEPYCDHFEWTFELTVEDSTGKSGPIAITAILNYGLTEIENSPPSEIRTRCDSTPTGVEELEENKSLLYFTNVDTFKPSLRLESCPSPFLYLDVGEDVIVSEGEPCTTNYKVIKRDWSLLTHDSACAVPQVQNPFFSQTITLGGLVDPTNGQPATPTFQLQDVPYSLPNQREATVATAVSDFYRSSMEPESECGLCSDPAKAIVFSHPQPFGCSEEGLNEVKVTVLNQIGVEVVKTATATVLDNFPPNVITKDHTVYLNQFGWLEEADTVTVVNVNGGTWDNCGIKSMSVAPTPIYQCADEGPQTVTLTAIDVSLNAAGAGNVATADQTVIVDDKSRLGIGEDIYLELPEKTDSLVRKKMKDDFDYAGCKEIGIYVRPEGESNFFPLDFPGWEGTANLGIPNYKEKDSDSDDGFEVPAWPARNDWPTPEFDDAYDVYYGKEIFWTSKLKWDVPKYDERRPYSMYFHTALCNGTRLPNNYDQCIAEIKAEVLCEDKSGGKQGKGKGKKKSIKQTCYRANLISDGPQKKGKSGKSKGKTKARGEKRDSLWS